MPEKKLRKSSQFLMPLQLNNYTVNEGEYNIYPVCALGSNKIFNGYGALSQWIIQQKTVVIDGYEGVFYNKIKEELDKQITSEGLTINWIQTSAYLKPAEEIETLVWPFLGTMDSVWGTR